MTKMALCKGLLAICLAAAVLMLNSAPALAGDPAGDARLKKFWTDVDRLYKEGPNSPYVETFKTKYKLNDAQAAKLFRKQSQLENVASSNGAYSAKAGVLCSFEIGTGIGAIIWEARRVQEINCYQPWDDPYHYLRRMSCYQYCMQYSTKCPHYRWCKGCLTVGKCDAPCKKKK